MNYKNEITGPPTAYFEVRDGNQTIRLTYETVVVKGSNQTLVRNEIRRQLKALRLWLAAANLEGSATLIWRTRPVYEQSAGQYSCFMRFATTPPLSWLVRKELSFKVEGDLE